MTADYTLPPLPKENSFFGAPKWHQVTEYGQPAQPLELALVTAVDLAIDFATWAADAARAPIIAANAALSEANASLLARIAELEADAKRGRFCYEKAEWHRYDGRTYLAIRVPDGSDLSCLALRRDALDAAMKGPQHSEDREGSGDA